MLERTALYARVSSEQQAKEGTVRSQLEAIRAYSTEQGWRIEACDEYIDNGISGTRLERAGLERLRDEIACGAIRRVVVLSRDRLSRDFIHQEYLRQEWGKAGCELVYVQEPTVETPEDLLASRVRGIFAEYERFALLERTRRGQIYRARQGEPPSSVPWGYRYVASEGRVPAHWEVEAEIAGWVRQVYQWVWQDHLPLGTIARQLHQCGILPAGGGRSWQASSVQKMLRNPAYRGETYYRRSQRKHSRCEPGPWQQLRPPEDWIRIAVPAIVSRDEWEMVQEELGRHVALAQRHASARRYLLQGLLRCGKCGRRLAGKAEGDLTYYVCRSKRNLLPEERCDSPWSRADALEDLIWRSVKELVCSPEQVLASYQEQHQAWLSSECEQERRALELENQSLQQRWQRMLSAYQHEAISLEELKHCREQKECAEQDWASRQRSWEQRQKQWQGFATALSELEKYRSTIQTSIENLTFEQKRTILTLLLEEVVVFHDKVTIRHILPALSPRLLPSPGRGE